MNEASWEPPPSAGGTGRDITPSGARPRLVGVIPAAGLAKRLGLASGSKEMLVVCGRPVMDVLLERMRRVGVEEVMVITRPEKHDVIAHAAAEGLSVVLGRPPSPAASIAAGLVGLAPHDVVLIGYPDTLWTPADGYRPLVAALSGRPDIDVAVGLFRTPDAARSDVVVLDDQGLVREIVVKSPTPPSDLIYGCVAARRSALEGLELASELSAHILPLCRRGRVLAVPLLGRWLDIGTPEALARAQAFSVAVADHGRRQAVLDPTDVPRSR